MRFNGRVTSSEVHFTSVKACRDTVTATPLSLTLYVIFKFCLLSKYIHLLLDVCGVTNSISKVVEYHNELFRYRKQS